MANTDLLQDISSCSPLQDSLSSSSSQILLTAIESPNELLSLSSNELLEVMGDLARKMSAGTDNERRAKSRLLVVLSTLAPSFSESEEDEGFF